MPNDKWVSNFINDLDGSHTEKIYFNAAFQMHFAFEFQFFSIHMLFLNNFGNFHNILNSFRLSVLCVCRKFSDD